MEKNNFKIKKEIDFNETSLSTIYNETEKSEEEFNLRFQTMIQKSIEEVGFLNTLLQSAKKIDFDLEANGEHAISLRKKFENDSNLKTKSFIQKEIQSITPNNSQKYVIIINNLLRLSEKLGYGMGMFGEDFYFFNGKYWEQIETELLIAFLGDFGEKSGLEPVNAQQFKVKDLLFKQFKVAAQIPRINTHTNEIRIPLLNGTLILEGEKVELVNFKKEYFLKYQLQFSYDRDAKADKFQKFLDRVLPDKTLQDVIFEYFGTIFLKNANFEKMLVLYGNGRNGKSVINDVICTLLGRENVTNYSLASLCEAKSQTRGLLENKLLNFAQEIGSGRFDNDILKTLSSNQPCEVKILYKNPYTMYDYARLAFNCNSLPKNSENTDAYFRRYIIVPFKERITDEEIDTSLANKIISDELPGVFNLILEGMQRYIKNKDFTKSESIEKEIDRFRKDSNSVLSFLSDENYTPSVKQKTSLESFYGNYRNYCLVNGFQCYQIKNFSTQLRNEGFEVKRSDNGYTFVFYEKIILGFNPDDLFNSDGSILIKA